MRNSCGILEEFLRNSLGILEEFLWNSCCIEFANTFISETKIITNSFIFTDELMDKYEHCKGILDSYESDYDNGDSEFGIVNEEDNLINSFELCQIQLFSQSHHRGEPINFKVGKWKKHTIRSLRVSGFCCFRIR